MEHILHVNTSESEPQQREAQRGQGPQASDWQDAEACLENSRRTQADVQRLEEATRAEMERAQAAGEKLLQACTAARAAQEALRAEVESMGLLVAAAAGRAPSDAKLAMAMKRVQAAFSEHASSLLAVRSAQAAFSQSSWEPLRWSEHFRLQASALAALHRLGNQQAHDSLLLSLPDAPLQLVATGIGPAARLVCSRMYSVYGSPSSSLAFQYTGNHGSSYRPHNVDAMADLSAWARGWKWPGAVTQLRIPNDYSIDTPTRELLARTFPQVEHLHWGGGPGDGSLSLPLWPSVCVLTCDLPRFATMHTLPFAVPCLRRLHLMLPYRAYPRHASWGQRLQPLTALTHLSIEGSVESFELQQQLGSGLVGVAGSLASLQLSTPGVLGAHLSALKQLQLRTLVVDTWRENEAAPGMPPLHELPTLERLYLRNCHNISPRTTLARLQHLLQQRGSPQVQSLIFPIHAYLKVEASAARWLYDTWPRFTALTGLTLSGQLYPPAQFIRPSVRQATPSPRPQQDTEARRPWLSGVARLPVLQRLAIELGARDLGRLSCLQPLTSLTHLHLTGCWTSYTPSQQEHRASGSTAGLEHLRSLVLTMKWHSSNLMDTTIRSECMRFLQQVVATLPCLEMLDLVGLGALEDGDAVHLQPLLAPGCHVQTLTVDGATQGMPGAAAGTGQHAQWWGGVRRVPGRVVEPYEGWGPEKWVESDAVGNEHGSGRDGGDGGGSRGGGAAVVQCGGGVAGAGGSGGAGERVDAGMGQGAADGGVAACAILAALSTMVAGAVVGAPADAAGLATRAAAAAAERAVGIAELLAQLQRKMTVVWQRPSS